MITEQNDMQELHRKRAQRRYDHARAAQRKREQEILNGSTATDPAAILFGQKAGILLRPIVWELTRIRANRVNAIARKVGTVGFDDLFDQVTDDLDRHLSRRCLETHADKVASRVLVLSIKHLADTARADGGLPRFTKTEMRAAHLKGATDIWRWMQVACDLRLRGMLKRATTTDADALDFEMKKGYRPDEDLFSILADVEADLMRGVGTMRLVGWRGKRPGGRDTEFMRVAMDAAVGGRGMDVVWDVLLDDIDGDLKVDWMAVADDVLGEVSPTVQAKAEQLNLPLASRAQLAHRAVQVHLDYLRRVERDLYDYET